ncbi:hypothetical protein ACHAWF_015427, partial [Thalassiosira exigua]
MVRRTYSYLDRTALERACLPRALGPLGFAAVGEFICL